MRTLRISGLVLMTILLVVSLTSCSKSDDDDESGVNTKLIEGSWYLNLITYYDWDYEINKSMPEPTDIKKPHGTVIWKFIKQEGVLLWTSSEKYTDDLYLHRISGNEYYTTRIGSTDKLDHVVFKSVSEHEMIVEYNSDSYCSPFKEYNVYNLIR